MAGGPVGGSQNIARRVVAVLVGCCAVGFNGSQLIQGIIGVCVLCAVFRVGGNISQGIVGVAIGDIRRKIVLQLGHLGGGFVGAGDIPVDVGLPVDSSGDTCKPLEVVVAECQLISNRRSVGCQEAVCLSVSEGLRIARVPHLPGLLRQLIVGVIGLPGGQNVPGSVPDGTGHQTA